MLILYVFILARLLMLCKNLMNKLQKEGENMPEQQLIEYAHKIESTIKIALLNKNMTQKELADLIHESPTQLNRAIKGDMSPKSRELRKKIETILNLKG